MNDTTDSPELWAPYCPECGHIDAGHLLDDAEMERWGASGVGWTCPATVELQGTGDGLAAHVGLVCGTEHASMIEIDADDQRMLLAKLDRDAELEAP